MGRLTGNTSSRRTIFHQHTRIHKDTGRVVATAAAANCYIHFFCTKTSALVVCLCDYVRACVCVCVGWEIAGVPSPGCQVPTGHLLLEAVIWRRAEWKRGPGWWGGWGGGGGYTLLHTKLARRVLRSTHTMMCTLAASHKLQMIRGVGLTDGQMDGCCDSHQTCSGWFTQETRPKHFLVPWSCSCMEPM